MIVSYNWLKELVNLKNISKEQLTKDLSLYSVEVESSNDLVNATNLVIGHVLECVPHPDSDHLNVCQVNIGSSTSQIVCGAPNVAKNQKVIVALPGAVLPEMTIKAAKVRGVESNGMICSLQELGIENKYVEEKYSKGIYVLDDNAECGKCPLEYLALDDYQIELGLTPNRMDLMSMLGVAQDVNAMYGTGLIDLDFSLTEDETKNINDYLSVEVNTSDCLSYNAKYVENVIIKESPAFIKSRLIASGIRPINNVVDITNYILVLFGQPLHAFNYDKLGNKIVVRNALVDETTVTLDDQTRKLSTDDIVITDGTTVTCIAGVMGCENTEVKNDTTTIVLESAVFNPMSVRKTSSRLGLRSESSVRFERGVDINRSKTALDYACYLLTKYADANVVSGTISKGTTHIENREFEISHNYIPNYLGIELSVAKQIEIFNLLGFTTTKNSDTLTVSVPNRRLDIQIAEDLVEEAARINGYDKLNETSPKMNVASTFNNSMIIQNTVSKTLVGAGLNEVITYSLVSNELNDQFAFFKTSNDGAIKLLHPMTENNAVLRNSLIPSLINVEKYNLARKMKDIAIFEMSKTFEYVDASPCEKMHVAGLLSGEFEPSKWQGKNDVVDFYAVKGIIEMLFTKLGISVTYEQMKTTVNELHPGRSANIIYNKNVIGYISAVHPKFAQLNGINETYVFEIDLTSIFEIALTKPMFKQINKLPSIERDLSFVMPIEQQISEIINAIKSTDKQTIKSVKMFDLYIGENIGENQKSVAFKIEFVSDKQLTEDDIQSNIAKIIKSLAFRFKINLRG